MAKIKFGLKNVHYAIVTETTNASGAIETSYGAVKAWPGAVNLSLDAQGGDNPFYADDGVYYMLQDNNGYSGDFESALIPEDVYTSVMGQTKDGNGVYTETNNDTKKFVAFMFEFTMDASARRFLLYRCSLSRPSIASATKGENVEAQTETVTITATPRPGDGKVKSFVGQGDSAYAGWYTSVYAGGTVVPYVSVPEVVTVAKDGEITLAASVAPADATVTWSSSDSEVASVDSSTGVVTGVAVGNAIITASITVDGVTYTGTTTVIVTA